MHKCPKCGAEFDGKYCTRCGYPLSQPIQKQKTAKAKQNRGKISNWVKNHLILVIPVAIALVIVIVLMSLIPTFISLGKNDNGTEQSGGDSESSGSEQGGSSSGSGGSEQGGSSSGSGGSEQGGSSSGSGNTEQGSSSSGSGGNTEQGGNPQAHTHVLQYSAKKGATCTKEGSIEYWYCLVCKKHFLDDKGENEISSTTIPATGIHEYNTDNVCKNCGDVVIPSGGIIYTYNSDTDTYTVARSSAASGDIVIPYYHEGRPVISIAKSAFYKCSGLTSITIPNSVTSIGQSAFSYCSSLTSITIPNGVTSIGNETFSGCSALTSVTIPASLTSIGWQTFYNCNNLSDVYITDVEAWCRIIFSTGTANPLYYAKNLYLNNELVTEFIIPNGITSIKDYAFYNCSFLTSITIPESVASIGESAFYNCSSLTNITLPANVTSIGNSAFENCSSLTNITIPNGVTSINNAFTNCSELTSITIPESVISFGNAFESCIKLKDIYYSGKMNEWNAISKSTFWNTATGNFTVHCSDGNLNKSGNEIA